LNLRPRTLVCGIDEEGERAEGGGRREKRGERREEREESGERSETRGRSDQWEREALRLMAGKEEAG
jgi:hypothetical protein